MDEARLKFAILKQNVDLLKGQENLHWRRTKITLQILDMIGETIARTNFWEPIKSALYPYVSPVRSHHVWNVFFF